MSLIRQVYYYNRVKYCSAQIVSRGVFIIFKSAIRQLKIIGKYGLNSTRWYWNYIYTSLLKIYVAKLIISGTDNRGATKHWSNLDIISNRFREFIFLAIQFLFSFNPYSMNAKEKERKERKKEWPEAIVCRARIPVILVTVIVEDK